MPGFERGPLRREVTLKDRATVPLRCEADAPKAPRMIMAQLGKAVRIG